MNYSNEILELYSKLRSSDLKPTNENNRSFKRLVEIASNKDLKTIHGILNNPKIQEIIPSLHKICSRGECLLEFEWANKIIESRYPEIEIEKFPYYKNYSSLISLEIQSLNIIDSIKDKRILFIGSGPLPLSSIVLSKKHSINTTNLEINPSYFETSKKLIEKLKLDKLRIVNQDVMNFEEFGNYDVIYLASLVGLSNNEKQRILSHIGANMNDDAFLLIRTAHKLKTLMYPKVEIDDKILDPQLVIHPLNEIVNSVIIAKKALNSENSLQVLDKWFCHCAS